MTLEKEIVNDFGNADEDHFYQPTWREILRLWRTFFSMTMGLMFFYPVVVGWNAFRLRCPIFKKRRCLIKISRKEKKSSNIAIPSGDELIPSTLKSFLVFFDFRGAKEYVEVGKEIYDQLQIKESLIIEYIEGKDRLHARVPLPIIIEHNRQ